MPIVNALLQLGVTPRLAGAGPSLQVLQDHFPQLECRELPAYNVRYKNFFSLLPQLPRLSGVIQKERSLLQLWVEEGWTDGVISDNRYGLYHKEIPSVFVCHQLAPLPPFGGEVAHWLSHKMHGHFMRHFDQLWIPDSKDESSLSGKLSHRFGLEDVRQKWLGPLSRYAGFERKKGEKKWDIVVLLSGPEPQRGILEEKIKSQLSGIGKSSLLIQGLRANEPVFEEQEGYTICNYLGGEALADTLQSADVVIARSGYSSLMDFAALGLKKLILIPTPGQTEQEYLARRLSAQQKVWVERQGAISLERGAEKVAACNGLDEQPNDRILDILGNWIGS